MRLCVEVKDPQREPIRVIVQVIRPIWYDRREVESQCRNLPENAALRRQYLHAALQMYRDEIPDPVQRALDRDLEEARATGEIEKVVQVLEEMVATADSVGRCMAVGRELRDLGRHAEALAACERGIEIDPEHAAASNNKGWTLNALGRHTGGSGRLRACHGESSPKLPLAGSTRGGR